MRASVGVALVTSCCLEPVLGCACARSKLLYFLSRPICTKKCLRCRLARRLVREVLPVYCAQAKRPVVVAGAAKKPGIEQRRLVVAKRCAIQVCHPSTRAFHHALTCGNVPFVSWTEARIKIDAAFSHEAQFQRAADHQGLDHLRLLRHASQKRAGFFAGA